MQKLKEKYKKEAVPEMMKKFGFKNSMAVPSIKKVVLNSSFGKDTVGKAAGEREKIQNFITQDLSLIAGQKPKLVKSKKSSKTIQKSKNAGRQTNYKQSQDKTRGLIPKESTTSMRKLLTLLKNGLNP